MAICLQLVCRVGKEEIKVILSRIRQNSDIFPSPHTVPGFGAIVLCIVLYIVLYNVATALFFQVSHHYAAHSGVGMQLSYRKMWHFLHVATS